MPEPLFDARVNYNMAYHNDGTHEYFGYAPRGAKTSDATWQIVKFEYTTSYSTAGDPWIIKWADGDDLPDNEWDEVENLTYDLLRKR